MTEHICQHVEKLERLEKSNGEFYVILTGNGSGKPGLGELIRDNAKEIKYIKTKLNEFISEFTNDQKKKPLMIKDWIIFGFILVNGLAAAYNFLIGG